MNSKGSGASAPEREGKNADRARASTGGLQGDGGHPQGKSGVDRGRLDRGRGGVPVPGEHGQRRQLVPRLDGHPRQRRFDQPAHREPTPQRDRLHGRAADPGRNNALQRGETRRNDTGRTVRASALGDARPAVNRADVDDAARGRPGDHRVSVPAHEDQPRVHPLERHPGQRAEYDELHAHQRALGCGKEIHVRGPCGERGGRRPRGKRRRQNGGVGGPDAADDPDLVRHGDGRPPRGRRLLGATPPARELDGDGGLPHRGP